MSRKVYVGKIAERTRERDLEDVFSKYGKITDLIMKYGYAFIEYDDPRDASDAIRDMDGQDLDGSKLIVEPSHGGGPRDRGPDRDRGRRRGPSSYSTPYRVSIENLPSSCDWRDLKDLTRSIANPTFADVHRNGTGVVHFERPEDVRRAIRELDDTRFQGNRIYVREERAEGGRGDRYQPYSRRSPSPGRSPSPRRRSPSPRGRSPSPRRSPGRY